MAQWTDLFENIPLVDEFDRPIHPAFSPPKRSKKMKRSRPRSLRACLRLLARQYIQET